MINPEKNIENDPIDVQNWKKRGHKLWIGPSAALAGLAVILAIKIHIGSDLPAAQAQLPEVGVSTPLQRDLDTQLSFLGQYSAVERVELRAQVGGTLTEIHFKDGDLVRKGDLLFVIDAEPYQIKLSRAEAQLQAANARLDLATRQLARAQALKTTNAGSAENVEQRLADKLSAQAAVNGARAEVRDARFDLDHTRITAPLTGRIGSRQVSIGNLVAGSRGATSPTTLLTTLVSLDPIYLDFDMSEADYNTYIRSNNQQRGQDRVAVSSSDSTDFSREGTLDFIDNALDRSSGTIHARAIISNDDMQLTPGGFARVRLSMSRPTAMLLVPDASVLPEQSEHYVLTVADDGTVATKRVELGELRRGLRVIRSGLMPTDRVVIDGIPVARPGSKVTARGGAIEYSDSSDPTQQVSMQ